VLDYIFEKLQNKKDKEVFEKWLGIENNIVTSQCESV